jgi:primosomal protein N' (replication factor Y) (superfamily II helicase)
MDVLVGTQMVAKGHDFQRVTLVGVSPRISRLGRPDFRAAERTFQLLTQVAGRAGRGELSGEVLVETHYPEHYAIRARRVQQDYLSFYEKEAHFRAHAALPTVHRASLHLGPRPESRKRDPLVPRAWPLTSHLTKIAA